MNPPPPGYPGPGYPPYYPPPGHPPGYPPYPPPRYPVPGYGAAGYTGAGYPPAAYPTPGYLPTEPQPGVIPLRPLTLSEIYNGAVNYIRANPKVTLGLTAVVVIITSLITLITQAGPLAVIDQLGADPSSYELSGRDVVVWGTAAAVGAVITSLGTIVLIGMLTVVVGRAVFGSSITAAEAWAIVRGRFMALIGLAALLALCAAALVGLGVFLIAVAIATIDTGGAAIIAMPLILALAALAGYLYIMVSFAPVAVVLERLPVFAAISRSFTLVRGAFWRVLGILLLTGVVTYLVTSAVALPFNLAGIALDQDSGSATVLSLPALLTEVGTTIGQIVALPFTAGVVVLLYADRRIRAEAFDLVLRTGTGAPVGGSTDNLWLTRPIA